MGLTKSKKYSDGRERSNAVRSLTCGQVMTKPRLLIETASVAEALDKITINEWDHLFIIDSERVPIGRVHAIDLLKLIAKKSVNREVAWMHSIPAGQLVTQGLSLIHISEPTRLLSI